MKRDQGDFVDALFPIKRKGTRKRWKGTNKQIYEEDTQHGDLEKYNSRGKHKGSVDPDTGEIVKKPVRREAGINLSPLSIKSMRQVPMNTP